MSKFLADDFDYIRKRRDEILNQGRVLKKPEFDDRYFADVQTGSVPIRPAYVGTCVHFAAGRLGYCPYPKCHWGNHVPDSLSSPCGDRG
jgi:hypothetical protein